MNKITTLRVSAKCSDMFDCQGLDANGKKQMEFSGYVPDWFPNPNVCHYGDYVQLDIDVETGRILNWRKPTQAQIMATKE